jgi:hypothetical protein
MPTLLVDEEGFRVVHDVVSGEDVFTLEQRDGDDAMGQPHWRRIDTKNARIISLLYKYIIKEKVNAQ